MPSIQTDPVNERMKLFSVMQYGGLWMGDACHHCRIVRNASHTVFYSVKGLEPGAVRDQVRRPDTRLNQASGEVERSILFVQKICSTLRRKEVLAQLERGRAGEVWPERSVTQEI